MAKEMREATFTILTALADGPRHGYGVMAEVSELSGGSVQLLAGTLYAALERLRTDALITVVREEIVQGRLRRFYALTDLGRQSLLDEAERRRTSAQRALDRLRATPLALAAQARVATSSSATGTHCAGTRKGGAADTKPHSLASSSIKQKQKDEPT